MFIHNSWSIDLFVTDTFPLASWKKSQCGLEFQYGNLVLLRLVEVKDYYLADPVITSITIINNGEFCKKPNREFHGITLEVMDVYPIIKYSECKFGLRSSEKQTDSVKFYERRTRLVRTKPVKMKRKSNNAKKLYKNSVKHEQRNNEAVFCSTSATINDQTNTIVDLTRNQLQNFNGTSGSNLLRALDLAVTSTCKPHSKIYLAIDALLLDTSYGNNHSYKLCEDFTSSKSQKYGTKLSLINRTETIRR